MGTALVRLENEFQTKPGGARYVSRMTIGDATPLGRPGLRLIPVAAHSWLRAWTAVGATPTIAGMPVCQGCGEDNPVRARFCLACGTALAPGPQRGDERKVVSVLFCDLVGFTSRAERLDVEDVRRVLRPYYARLRAELERYGGTVEKFIGDAVMALFGAPVAHEDDPERAVRAALAIREAIAEFNQADPSPDLHVRVGVTTGEALITLDARPVEGEGMASGDVVNTAARLQGAAPVDGVLVDQATYWATNRQIAYREAEPVRAKGKAEPVPVWQALELGSTSVVEPVKAPRVELIGRGAELALLEAALTRARTERRPQLALVVGVPGIGKSRLVSEIAQQVAGAPEPVTWRQGRCLPYGEGIALWALGEIVKGQAGILETDPVEAAANKLVQAVTNLIADQQEAAWVTSHLRPLVGLSAAGEASSDRQAEAFAAWRRFLEALADRRPTVLLVEDLHWADDALLEFLEYLVDGDASKPLLLIATARPELLSRRPGWEKRNPRVVKVLLAPLSEAATARLLAALLDQTLIPAELQTDLLEKAGGNPLYAEEYVRMLADRGFLRRTGRTWRREAGQVPLPETVQGIIAARLDALSPGDKALLADAAVLGTVSWLGALATLGGTQPSSIQPRLRLLEHREFLREEPHSAVAGERQYSFRHVLVRDVAYAQLPRGQRADRHRRAAEWIEALSPDRAEDRAELLAHHYLAAVAYTRADRQDTTELAERAQLACANAGDRALELNAFSAAARWYAAALDHLDPEDPARPRLLFRLGRARFHAEQAGGEQLAEARNGLLAAGDRESAAEAVAMLGKLAWWAGEGTRGIEHDRRAAELLAGAPPSRAKATVLVELAALLMVAGRNREAIQVGREGLAIAERLGLDDIRADALNHVGAAMVSVGDPAGFAGMEQAVALAVQANSPLCVIAYVNLASALIECGELRRGFELQAEGRRAAERFGFTAWQRHLRAERVLEDYWRGRWDAAEHAAAEFVVESEAGSRHYMASVCRLVLGRIRLARGQLSAAVEHAAAVLESARLIEDPQMLNPALAFAAAVALRTGRSKRAEALANELLAGLAGHDGALMGSEWPVDLAIVLAALGRGNELADLAATITISNRWLEAATAFATGDPQRAAELYRQIGSLPDEAFARLQAARHLLGTGRQAEGRAQLQRALALHRDINASGHVREAELLTDRLMAR
jgi:class 3 adenylate cyclase/tetratricopeptide (TPR) repeat protein